MIKTTLRKTATKRALANHIASAPPAATRNIRTEFTVQIACTATELESFLHAWDDLAQSALETNVFYESWMLLPALRAWGDDGDLRVVMIFAESDSHAQDRQLCGLFPLILRRGYKGLPLKVLTLWRHNHCFLCTPLVREDRAEACLAAFFDWAARSAKGASIFALPYTTGDGPFHQALASYLRANGRRCHTTETIARACYQPVAYADEYWRNMMSRRHCSEYRRRERRLKEQGNLEYRLLESNENLDSWIEQFIWLEGKGWKGRGATALTCRERDRAFFQEVVSNGYRRQQVLMQGMYLDGSPLAMHCCLLSGEGAFAFKTAYDERYARYSPGILLVKALMDCLEDFPTIRWVDSCAAFHNDTLNSLWSERRRIDNLLVSTKRVPGILYVSAIPKLKWLAQRLPGHKRIRPCECGTRSQHPKTSQKGV